MPARDGSGDAGAHGQGRGDSLPLIRANRGAECQAPNAVMDAEHLQHGDTLECLATLTDNFQPPAGAFTTWRALYLRLEQLHRDLMDHIHLEIQVLFPWALAD